MDGCRCALAHVMVGFHQSEIANIDFDDPNCDPDDLKRKALENIQEAEDKFRKLNDMVSKLIYSLNAEGAKKYPVLLVS